MCHSTESRPPAAPATGNVRASGHLVLTAADGARSGAYEALPAVPNGRHVVLLPDVRGAHPYYRELARQFAAAGFGAVVVDYYGRTAGVGGRDDDFDWERYLPDVTPAEVLLDTRAAMARLAGADAGAGAVFTVGFCFGGSLSWRFGAADAGLAGVIGFYGQPKTVEDVADRVSAPTLMLVAGDDIATPQEDFDRFAARHGGAS